MQITQQPPGAYPGFCFLQAFTQGTLLLKETWFKLHADFCPLSDFLSRLQLNVTTVRENLPKGDFSIMTEMLKKFLNFMNLTVSQRKWRIFTHSNIVQPDGDLFLNWECQNKCLHLPLSQQMYVTLVQWCTKRKIISPWTGLQKIKQGNAQKNQKRSHSVWPDLQQNHIQSFL